MNSKLRPLFTLRLSSLLPLRDQPGESLARFAHVREREKAYKRMVGFSLIVSNDLSVQDQITRSIEKFSPLHFLQLLGAK